MTDEELMAAICAGNHGAYEAIVRRHLKPVSRYAWRLLGNTRDVEDIAQETFLKVWVKAASWQPAKAGLSTWIHRIAHNLCVDHLRKRREEPAAELEELARGPGPLDAALADGEMAGLRAALERLPVNQRGAISLCHYQGFSNKEAAMIMNLSVQALESLLARGRRSLREALPAEEKDGGASRGANSRTDRRTA